MYVTEGFNWTPPSAWGMPRTPLLPKWHIEVLSSVPLPPNIGFALFGSQDTTHTIGDLKDYWNNHSEPVPSHHLRSLLRLVSKHQQPPDDYHVIPPNVAISRISVCPLSVRIQNCLRRYWRNPHQDAEESVDQLVDQSVARPMTAGFLMSLQNFGITSLIELMCVVEAAIDNGLLLPSQPPQLSQTSESVTQSSVVSINIDDDGEVSISQTSEGGPRTNVDGVHEASSDTKPSYLLFPAGALVSGWAASIPLLQQLISVAAEFHSAETLADALTCDLKQLMNDLDVTEEIGSVSLSDLVPKRSLTEDSLDVCRQFCETLSSSQREILTQRIISTDAPSLAELARGMDVTGEAVRRSEKRLEDNINELCGKLTSSNNPSASSSSSMSSAASSPLARWLNVTVTAISSQCGDITTQNDLQASINHALGIQADSAKVNHDEGETVYESEADSEKALPYLMAEHLLRQELGYVSVGKDDICLNRTAAELFENLKETAKSIADNVGLVDELALRSRLPSDMSEDHADTLIDQCGFTRFHDHLALRDTGKARAKAALMEIGRPATKEEIAESSGFDVARVSSLLSSVEDVVRASKTKWGVEEWVDDVYEGIPAEIIQRINEDGGSTALSRLTEELPRMFEVSETSVTAYVATSKFQLVDGNVSLADVSSINLRSFADTVEGYTSDGRACWKFKVEARYFNGYSLLGLPPEIAKTLGCEPDGRKRVPVRSPSSCGPISVSWPLTSLGGATLGYLSEPLRKLRLNSGDHALLVINNDNTVSIQPNAELVSEPLTVQTDNTSDAHAPDSATGDSASSAEAISYAPDAEAISGRGAGDTTHPRRDYRHQDYTRGRDKLERIKNRRKVF